MRPAARGGRARSPPARGAAGLRACAAGAGGGGLCAPKVGTLVGDAETEVQGEGGELQRRGKPWAWRAEGWAAGPSSSLARRVSPSLSSPSPSEELKGKKEGRPIVCCV